MSQKEIPRNEQEKQTKILIIAALAAIVIFLCIAVQQYERHPEPSAPGISYGHHTLKVSTDRYRPYALPDDDSRMIFIDMTSGNRLIVPLGPRFTLVSEEEDEIEFNITEVNNFSLLTDDPDYRWQVMNVTEFIRNEIKVRQIEGETIENLSSRVLMASDLKDGKIQIADVSFDQRSKYDFYRMRLANGNESCWYGEAEIEDGLVAVKETSSSREKYLLDKSGQGQITRYYENFYVVDGKVYGIEGPKVSAIKVYDSPLL